MQNHFETLGKLAEAGVEITMLSATSFVVSGFYKSDTVNVDLLSETITARYGEVTEFGDDLLRTLTELNYSWWKHSKDRYDGWRDPAREWLPLLIEHGYVTKTETVVVEYK